MKSLSAKTFQCGVTVQGLTTLSGTVYLTALTNTATWDYVVVGTTAQGQLYTRTYAQLMSDITSGIGLSGYVPTSRTLTINGVSYDLTANRSWTISTVDYTSRLQHQVKAGVAINKGQAVYVTSADGTNMIVGLASNASEATSSKTMGLLDATVSTNGFANVVTEGLLAGLDTSTAGTEGDPVWLGTGGNLIYGLANKPYAPAHLVFIGIVTRKNSNNGEIFVKVQNGFELKEIHDVDLITTTPVNGHLLGFNGTLWVNKTIAGWLGYTPANASGTTNYISKFTGSTTLGNSQIFDNGTNVGIGTASPSYKLHVNGNAYINETLYVNQATTIEDTLTVKTATGAYDVAVIDYSGVAGGRIKIYTDGILRSQIGSYYGDDTFFNVGYGGNVGIGISTPSAKFQVTDASSSITLQNYLDGAAIFLDGVNGDFVGGDYFHILADGNSYLGVGGYAGGATPLNVRNNGNVGIGTTSPASQFHLQGSNLMATFRNSSTSANQYTQLEFIAGSRDAYIWLGNQNTTSWAGDGGLNIYTGTGNMDFWTAATQRMRLTAGGNILMNTTNSPTAGGFTNTTLSVKQVADGLYGGGLHIEENATTSVAYFGFNGSVFNIGTSYRTTGNYRPITFSTNGAERLRIANDGYVGIGTTSPDQKLHIKRTETVNRTTYTDILTIDADANNSPFSGHGGGILFRGTTYSGSANNVQGNRIWGRIGMFLNDFYDGFNGESMFFAVAPDDRSDALITAMTIQYNGNVGIGTTAPAKILDIAVPNAAHANYGIRLNSVSGYGGASLYHDYGQGNGSTVFKIANDYGDARINLVQDGYNSSGSPSSIRFFTAPFGGGDVGVERVRFASDGNVGIGTTSPAAALHTIGTGIVNIVQSSNDVSYTQYYNTSTSNGGTNDGLTVGNNGLTAYVWQRESADLLLGTSNTEAIRITSTQNVGIGTTSPNARLDVNGTGMFASHVSATLLASNNGDGFRVFASTATAGGSQPGIGYYTVGGSKRFSNQLDVSSDTWGVVGTTGTNYLLISQTGAATFSSTLTSTDHSIKNSANAETLDLFLSPSTLNGFIDYPSGRSLILRNKGSLGGLTLASTGEATFSSSVTAAGAILVSNTINAYAYQNFGANSGYGWQVGKADNSGGIAPSNGFYIYDLTNSATRMVISQNGNVGIGNTSPVSSLSVVGKTNLGGQASGFYVTPSTLHIASSTVSQISFEDYIVTAAIAIANNTFAFGHQNISPSYEFKHSNTYNGNYATTGTTFARFNPTTSYISSGNVGIGTTTPSTLLDVSGVITATGGNSTNWNTAYGWGNHSSAGYVPQARTLTINGTSYDLSANRSWTIATTTPGGSDTQFQYNSSGSLAGASALTYNSTTNRVGINQASPGYDLDVNGQVRVQNKLRVGTVNSGNGVVHMSSSATINANTTTVVWAQNVSVGMCAFIEYYILNNNSLTDQRAGTIMVTWNQSGTPTIAHTETTTPDIGSTTSVNFTSSLVGSDARINAVNSSANPYTIVMSYKYF